MTPEIKINIYLYNIKTVFEIWYQTKNKYYTKKKKRKSNTYYIKQIFEMFPHNDFQINLQTTGIASSEHVQKTI